MSQPRKNKRNTAKAELISNIARDSKQDPLKAISLKKEGHGWKRAPISDWRSV
jgi:hypothetical protein